MVFYAKYCQASSTYKALHDPWNHIIFGLYCVSLAEYLLVLKVYFPHLLQIIQSIMCIVRTASVPPWMRSRPWARRFYISNLWCFCGMWSQWCEMLVSKLPLLPLLLHLNLVCNNFNCTRCMVRYLWTLCNMWHVCWIMYDLGCMLAMNWDPSWYSTYYRVYMGSSMIVRPLAGCHCTCALKN